MLKIGSLFSGAGGLDMAVESVFGGEVIWQSEVDRAASKVLAYRFPSAPNLGDITQIDWKTVESPDVLCGGFPCQDVSAAGRRAGIKDGTRSGLWAIFAEAIDALRPQYVVIENVRGLLSAAAHRTVEDDAGDYLEPDPAGVGDGSVRPVLRAAGAVLGDLADLGYDAQWTTVAASTIGAPHRRERVFIVAADRGGSCSATDSEGGARGNTQQQRLSPLRPGRGAGLQQPQECGGPDSPCCTDASDSTGYGRDEGRPESAWLKRGFDAAVSGDEPGVALLPTPSTHDKTGARSPESIARIDKPFANLNDTVVKELLPTPSACNANDGEGTETWLARREVVKARVKNGNGMGMPLSIAVQLLPTPTTQDGANCGGPSQFERNTLPLNAEVTLLPTPEAKNSHAGPDYARMNREGSGGHNLVTAVSYHNISDSQWGKYAPAIARWEALTRPAPAPTEPNRNGKPRLNPAFSEWMMGWPAGWVTDPVIGISRNDQLRIVGNGVCSQQAAAALRYLLAVNE